jgi:myo-inositol-1(or 4)-monophosphatase
MAFNDELLELARATAFEAGALLRERADFVRELVETKSSPTDMVTEVDRASEALIVERILAARPDDGILGEEGSERDGSSGVRWVIDPLDGTTNYLYGFPAYAVSIAVEVDGEPVVGVVYDAARDEAYWAARGSGAFCDGVRLQTSRTTSLASALTGTGFGYTASRRERQVALLAPILTQVRDIRRAGSAALDLCSVARGRLDAYFEWGLQAWDMAAGRVIIEEAGGRTEVIGTYDDAPLLIASNAALFEPFRELIRSNAQAILGPSRD